MSSSNSIHSPQSTHAWMASNPISLKQRLAALSANMSAIRMDSSPSSPGWRRKNFFSPPVRLWTTDGEPSRLGQEELERVMSSVIFQAGVDYELVAYFCLTHMELPFELTSSEHDQCALKSVIRLA